MTLPYSFGTGTTPDQNFFKQLQADFTQSEANIAAAIAAGTAAIAALSPQLAKAWASITCTNDFPDVSDVTATLADGYNVASVSVDNTNFYFVITMTTPFASVNWVPQVLALRGAGANELYSFARFVAADTVTVAFDAADGVRHAPAAFYFVGFGTQ